MCALVFFKGFLAGEILPTALNHALEHHQIVVYRNERLGFIIILIYQSHCISNKVPSESSGGISSQLLTRSWRMSLSLFGKLFRGKGAYYSINGDSCGPGKHQV